jgi:hypothetical protein
MKLQKNGDTWQGSYLESSNTVKYGKFTWIAGSSSLDFERGATVGLFVYRDDTHESDIEINQWPGYDQHLWMSVRPGGIDDHLGNLDYGVLSTDPHLHDQNIKYCIDWAPNYVDFSATAPDGTIIRRFTFTDSSRISQLNSSICMDLTPLDNRYYPESGNPVEIVLKSFTYTPYEGSDQASTSATGASDGATSATNPTSNRHHSYR